MRLSIIVAALALAIVAPTFAASPFSDVPQGHWAYKAIEKAVEAGILQGYDGKFHGNKTLNRYQMAVVVARMLDRIETMGPSGKVGKKDIENLEALTIEFADELALLNVKVSTLEDSFADLKKDVDSRRRTTRSAAVTLVSAGCCRVGWPSRITIPTSSRVAALSLRPRQPAPRRLPRRSTPLALPSTRSHLVRMLPALRARSRCLGSLVASPPALPRRRRAPTARSST